MKSREVDKKLTKQIRIDSGLHHLLKINATRENTSLKTLVEGLITSYLGTEKWK